MVTEPPATAIFNLTSSDRSAGQQDRRAEVTNGEADHFPTSHEESDKGNWP